MNIKETFSHLQSRFGDAIESLHDEVLTPFLVVKADRWHDVAAALRDDEALAFDFLRNLCGVDYPDQNAIASVYHLFSVKHRHECGVKVMLDRSDPKVASVTDLWPAANWHEREAFDLLGIVYEGHPNPKRILLPDDWEGHPLRKDYKSPESYHGIANIAR